ncbi:DUF2125 domain-containing protein [Rhodopila globiformis]|nr:DUF2125 domain-containing protein [Rhodopila globiformis]
MRRITWVILAAIAILLVAADVVYWHIASDRLRRGFLAWTDARRAEGWEVETGAVSLGGWPEATTVTVPNMHLHHSGKDFPGGLDWTSASTTLRVSLYAPTVLALSFSGPQHLRVGGAPDIVIVGDRIDGVAPLQPDAAPVYDLNARDLRVEPASGPWHVTIGLLNGHADFAPRRDAGPHDAGGAQQAIGFVLSAEAIALPAGMRWALGPNISSFSTQGLLTGPFPANDSMTAAASAWRDGGGSLTITHLAMGWGPLGLTGSATLALDDQLQPMGSGNARLVGYDETLDRLAAGGMLTKSAAIAAKAVLSLIAEGGVGDEPSVVDVPLTLQYRTLSMRQVPLLRLPELDWPPR